MLCKLKSYKERNDSQRLRTLIIKSVEEGDKYKHLGTDENISYHGTIKKERILKEYFTQIRKIWCSELSAYGKVIAQ